MASNVRRAPIKTAMEGDFDTGNVRFKRERYSFDFLIQDVYLTVSYNLNTNL